MLRAHDAPPLLPAWRSSWSGAAAPGARASLILGVCCSLWCFPGHRGEDQEEVRLELPVHDVALHRRESLRRQHHPPDEIPLLPRVRRTVDPAIQVARVARRETVRAHAPPTARRTHTHTQSATACCIHPPRSRCCVHGSLGLRQAYTTRLSHCYTLAIADYACTRAYGTRASK